MLLGLTGLISLHSKGLSRVFSRTTVQASVLWHSAFFMVQLSHPYMTVGKTIPLTRWTFVGKVMSLPFNMLSRFFIAFLPRSKHLNFMVAVTICSDFGDQKNKVCHGSHFSPSIFCELMGVDAKTLVFWAPKSLQMVTAAMKLKDAYF